MSSNDCCLITKYPVQCKVVKVLQACFRDIFRETCLNKTIIDRQDKDKRHNVVKWSACMAWFRTFHGWRSLSSPFAWKEVSFGFRQMTWLWMSTFAVSGSCCGLIYRFVMDDENCVVLLWLVPRWYRRGTESVVSAPLHRSEMPASLPTPMAYVCTDFVLFLQYLLLLLTDFKQSFAVIFRNDKYAYLE